MRFFLRRKAALLILLGAIAILATFLAKVSPRPTVIDQIPKQGPVSGMFPGTSSTSLSAGASHRAIMDQTLLEGLAPLMNPPPGVKLPAPVVTAHDWQGSQCGVSRQSFVIFRDSDSWKELWDHAMAPYESRLGPSPEVDFSKDMVIGVFGGERSFPGARIEIVSVANRSNAQGEKYVVVRYRDIEGGRSHLAAHFAVHPFHLKKVPAFPGRPVLLKAP